MIKVTNKLNESEDLAIESFKKLINSFKPADTKKPGGYTYKYQGSVTKGSNGKLKINLEFILEDVDSGFDDDYYDEDDPYNDLPDCSREIRTLAKWKDDIIKAYSSILKLNPKIVDKTADEDYCQLVFTL